MKNSMMRKLYNVLLEKQPKLNKEHITVEEETVNEIVSEESYDNYQLPPVTLLNNPVKKQTITKGDVVEKSKILQSTFNNFGIEVKDCKSNSRTIDYTVPNLTNPRN